MGYDSLVNNKQVHPCIFFQEVTEYISCLVTCLPVEHEFSPARRPGKSLQGGIVKRNQYDYKA